ncbi:MAG TPA: Na+/H+ antiporter subunit E [Acidobacteriota bacterium]|nr:Na+/H+ antiporter subunit E [Acidobacteriota bacterium]
MKRSAILGLLLLAVWQSWSGMSFPWGQHFEPLLLAMGVVSTALVLLIARRMNVVDAEGAPVEFVNIRVLLYTPWLALEIVKANIDVVRRILHPRLPISPVVIEVAAGQRSEVGQVVYANSITLTPGTVSVLVDAATITVHALSREAAAGVETGEMDRRVTQLEEAD